MERDGLIKKTVPKNSTVPLLFYSESGIDRDLFRYSCLHNVALLKSIQGLNLPCKFLGFPFRGELADPDSVTGIAIHGFLPGRHC